MWAIHPTASSVHCFVIAYQNVAFTDLVNFISKELCAHSSQPLSPCQIESCSFPPFGT